MADEAREILRVREPAAIDEDEALAGFAQDLELPGFVRMQAEKHEPSVVAQPAEEIQHEADVAVLRVELRLVEKMHLRRRAPRTLEQERGPGALERADLVRLVVVDGEAVAIAIPDAVNILSADAHLAGRRLVAAGDELEERRLAGAVRPQHADDRRRIDDEVGFQRKRHLAAKRPARVALGDGVDVQERRGHSEA